MFHSNLGGFMIYFFIIFSVLLLLLMSYVLKENNKDKKRNLQLEKEWEELKKKNLIELDKNISSWLEMLELPQLEGKKKRLEVAHQLSIVLIGKLLRSQVPDYNPNT